MLKSFKIYTCANGALGLHLSRAPWDPYPWVSSIQKDSTSYVAGLRIGDCLLELNGQDVLGLKISQIAALLKNHWLNESSNYVTVVLWRNKCNNTEGGGGASDAVVADDDEEEEDEENNAHNINQQSLQKFATCLQHIAQLLECPVCLEVIKPPGWQCCNGHVLCNNCRSRSEKCPVCRVPLGPRGRCLLSDKLFTLLADSFPCDGVRSNKNSPKDRRKCSTEFHNQPKMAILQKQQQDGGEIKAKDLKKLQRDNILSSMRQRRRKTSWNKMPAGEEREQENKYTTHQHHHQSSMEKVMYGDTNIGNNSLSNSRKSSQDYSVVVVGGGGGTDGGVGDGTTLMQPGAAKSVVVGSLTMTTENFCNDELLGQTSTMTQCHCITCYKPDKVAIVNNVTATVAATTAKQNKYILQVSSQQQQQQEGQVAYLDQQQQQQQQQQYETKKYYQCPTGKLCCLTKNVMPSSATYTNTINNTNTNTTSTMTNNKLSTKKQTNEESATAATTLYSNMQEHTSYSQQLNEQSTNNNCNNNFHKTLKNEWEILAHLTEDHHLPVNQYYTEYGQRTTVHCDRYHKTLTCLNLKGANSSSTMEKFFIACIPIEEVTNQSSSSSASTIKSTKVAIFIYHMNTLTSSSAISSSAATATASVDEVSNFETIIENPQTGIKWFGRAHCLTTPWSHIYHKQHFLMHEVLENAADGGDAFVIVIKTKL